MAKTRHRNPRTAMCYVKPGGEAVAEVTELLDTAPARRGWTATEAKAGARSAAQPSLTLLMVLNLLLQLIQAPIQGGQLLADTAGLVPQRFQLPIQPAGNRRRGARDEGRVGGQGVPPERKRDPKTRGRAGALPEHPHRQTLLAAGRRLKINYLAAGDAVLANAPARRTSPPAADHPRHGGRVRRRVRADRREPSALPLS